MNSQTCDTVKQVTQFNPPYMFCGLYARENREPIEAPNRETIAKIFERRKQERETLAWARKGFALHNAGIHLPGFCPHCPASVFYD